MTEDLFAVIVVDEEAGAAAEEIFETGPREAFLLTILRAKNKEKKGKEEKLFKSLKAKLTLPFILQ